MVENTNPDGEPHPAIMLVSAYLVQRGLILQSIARNLALNLYRDANFNNMAQAKRKSQFEIKYILSLFRMK